MLNFADKKRQTLERRLTALVEEWEALSEELIQNRDVSDRLRIERQIEQLEVEIKKIESALKELDEPPSIQSAVVTQPSPSMPEAASAASPEPAPAATGSAASLKVFLCHGKEDKEQVRPLCDRLRTDGVDPWLDERRLLPGQNWKRQITRAVQESHVVLVCLSAQTVRKESFIQKEIKLALDVAEEKPEETIFIIPVRFDECEVPDRVSELHWLDYFAPDGYERLMLALSVRAVEIGVELRPAPVVVVETPAVVPPPPAPIVMVERSVDKQEAPPNLHTYEGDGAELILIPAGEFIMGSTEAEVEALLQSNSSYKREWFTPELPQRQVDVDAFTIYKTPVTAAQYLVFCQVTQRKLPEAPGFNSQWQNRDHPIVNVSWEDAMAYCVWLSGRTGLQVTLPTEAQWEKAARGTDGRQYPWGNEWSPEQCVNSTNSKGGTAAVGSTSGDKSPYGVLDMAGNVLEWCLDWFDADYYKSGPARNPPGPSSSPDGYRVLRGGSWNFDFPYDFRCANRGRYTPVSGDNFVGFRCVVRQDPA